MKKPSPPEVLKGALFALASVAIVEACLKARVPLTAGIALVVLWIVMYGGGRQDA